MATEKVRIKYDVDKKQLDASNKSLKKTEKSNKLVQKEVAKTTEKFKKQDKQLAKTNSLFSGLGGQLTAIGNRFQIAGKGLGDMAVGMFKTTAATGGLSKSMRILKVAIASTGIGLLVLGLVSLIAAFKSSESGQNKFAKIMATIGVVLGNFMDVLAVIGETLITAFESPMETIKSFVKIIKENIINRFTGLLELVPALGKAIGQLFRGDFAGAAETAGNAVAKVVLGVEDFTNKVVAGFNSATDAVKGFIDQTIKEVGISQALEDKRAATNLLQREFLVKTARLESRVADLRLKGRQEDDFTATQRLAFLNEANDLQNELITTELIIARNRAEEQRIGNTFSKSNIENLDKLAELEATVFRVEAKRLNQQRTLQREINTTTGQQEMEAARVEKVKQAAIDKDIQDKADEKERDAEELAAKKEAIRDLNIFRFEQAEEFEKAEMLRREIALEAEDLLEAEKRLIIEESEAKIKDIRQKAADDQDKIDEVLLDNKMKASDQGLSLAKSVAGQDTALAKAVALAGIFIDTKRAVVKAVALSPLTFGQPFSGFAIAQGIIAAASVSGLLPKFEKGGRIGGNLHSGGGTMIEAERDEFMMSRKATSKYGFDLMNKINNLELNSLTPVGDISSINIIDTQLIADTLKNMPQNIINVNSEGFTLYQIRGQHMLSQKIERYST